MLRAHTRKLITIFIHENANAIIIGAGRFPRIRGLEYRSLPKLQRFDLPLRRRLSLPIPRFGVPRHGSIYETKVYTARARARTHVRRNARCIRRSSARKYYRRAAPHKVIKDLRNYSYYRQARASAHAAALYGLVRETRVYVCDPALCSLAEREPYTRAPSLPFPLSFEGTGECVYP